MLSINSDDYTLRINGRRKGRPGTHSQGFLTEVRTLLKGNPPAREFEFDSEPQPEWLVFRSESGLPVTASQLTIQFSWTSSRRRRRMDL
jgi:hypothetical protein